MTTIHISNFVRRQTEQSGYSHWTISDEELLQRIETNLVNAKPGYRDGVILVHIDPEGFFSSVVNLVEGDKLVGEYVARQKGETPRKSTYVVGNKKKSKAVSVYAVLYSHAVLLENNENDTNMDYEIVSINASDTEEEMPIPTGALIANHLELNGGTKTNMSDSEFVELLRKSVSYWQTRSLICPEHLKELPTGLEKVINDITTFNLEGWNGSLKTDQFELQIDIKKK